MKILLASNCMGINSAATWKEPKRFSVSGKFYFPSFFIQLLSAKCLKHFLEQILNKYTITCIPIFKPIREI